MTKNNIFLLVFFMVFGCSEKQAYETIDSKTDSFDFWVGRWDATMYYYDRGGTKEWKRHGSFRSNVFRTLNDQAVVEFANGELDSGKKVQGFSIRYYDSLENKWIAWLNWPDKQTVRFYSMDGAFFHNRANFYTFHGSDSLLLRFAFSDITANSLRWDSHVSDNHGESWYPDGLFQLERIKNNEARVHYKADSVVNHLLDLKRLSGNWEGAIYDSQIKDSISISVKLSPVLSGYGLWKQTMVNGIEESVSLTSYVTDEQYVQSLRIRIENSDVKGTIGKVQVGVNKIHWEFDYDGNNYREVWKPVEEGYHIERNMVNSNDNDYLQTGILRKVSSDKIRN